jgi:hypothetical protein
MGDHQYVLAADKDTDDFHAHVIANRIGPDGRANDLWHERIIRERVCAEIAVERGWKIVIGHHNRDRVQRVEHLYPPPSDQQRRLRLSDGAYRRLNERGELPWQESARPYVLDAVDRARDWSDLHQRLAAQGVVVRLVRRGERVQGLAFAEGCHRNAPGCAASGIDPRCALRRMESRFGPFIPSREPMPTPVYQVPWIDKVRPTILAAVDAAKTWDHLAQRLDREGIAIKLVQRGGRVQGLAFAQGSDADAPGCGASRIHPRSKKAALEQRFGPFPDEAQQRPEYFSEQHRDSGRQSRSHLRERADREARSDPRWALHDAERIANHARMRSEYRAYRDRFFSDRAGANLAQRNAAWERERAQRQRDAKRRREARLLLRAAARLGMRGLLIRQLAYWSINVMMGRRRAQAYQAARVRWEATKIALASERGLARREKPMNYRSFVAERSRAKDPCAQRVLEDLAPARSRQHVEPQRESRPVSLEAVRRRLDIIRAEEEARYERARGQREQLQRVARTAKIEEALAAERKRIEKEVADATQFTEAERARLTEIAKQKRSWNSLSRAAASREEGGLRATQRTRFVAAVTEAMHDFEAYDVPQIARRVAPDERRHREYVAESLALEEQKREARAVLRDRIPRVEHRLGVIERAGLTQVELHGDTSCAGFSQLAAAVDQQYSALSDSLRREAERSIRREQRDRDWSRDMSMGR